MSTNLNSYSIIGRSAIPDAPSASDDLPVGANVKAIRLVHTPQGSGQVHCAVRRDLTFRCRASRYTAQVWPLLRHGRGRG
jgi:hypothetical protein